LSTTEHEEDIVYVDIGKFFVLSFLNGYSSTKNQTPISLRLIKIWSRISVTLGLNICNMVRKP